MPTRIALTDHVSCCSTCVPGQVYLPVGMNSGGVRKTDDLVSECIHIKKGQSLYSLGEPFEAVYGIRFGTLRTHLTLEDGWHQIMGFHLPGKIVGLDGIGDMRHVLDITALEDTEVCVVRYDELQHLSRRLPSLQHQFLRIMSKEISQDHLMPLTLGSMRAEERLAAFLLNLLKRSARWGCSSAEFMLRMSREELSSYLNLKLETVSRLFSRFAEAGLIQICQCHVKLIDLAGLR